MLLNYYKYYKEIKNRLVLTSICWVSCLGACYFYKEAVLFTLVNLNYSFVKTTIQPYFIFTDVAEIFHVYLELTLFVTNQIGIIFFFYQIFMFLSLGLYKFEFEKLKFALKIFALSWLFSIILLYKLIIPFSWNFFLSFQESSTEIQPFSFFFETKVIEYFHYFTNIYYICLANCQFLGLLAIALTGVSEQLKQTKTFRKLFYLIFVIFSTLITPPDIISQICISLGLILAYEALLLLKRVEVSMVAN